MIFYNPGVKEGPVDDTVNHISVIFLPFKTFETNALKVTCLKQLLSTIKLFK
jgi:hypothetical protein